MLEKIFHYRESGSSIKIEILAGIVTFMTMSYIIFVQPAILSQAGMDFGSVMVATCIGSALTTILMGLYANYPIALAPGMGENFFFAFTIVLTMQLPWQIALGAVFIEGILFILLTAFNLRKMIVDAISESLRHSIAVGIGIFIALIGLVDSGIIQKSAGGILELGKLNEPPVLLALFGLFLVLILITLKIRGAIFWGMISSLVIGLVSGLVKYEGIVSLPPSIEPTFFKLDIAGVFNWIVIPPVLVLLFMDLFDTIGTVVGVGERAGYIKNGEFPRINKVLMTDAIGTVLGSLFGTSTITSYIESASGVSEGGRTGLVSIVTGLLFLLAIFFYPLIKMVGGGYPYGNGFLYPITGPVLVVVGAFMMKSITKIDWSDPSEYLPSFLVIIGMAFTYNIAHGMAFGFITYPILKFVSGKGGELKPLSYILCLIFILRYIFLP